MADRRHLAALASVALLLGACSPAQPDANGSSVHSGFSLSGRDYGIGCHRVKPEAVTEQELRPGPPEHGAARIPHEVRAVADVDPRWLVAVQGSDLPAPCGAETSEEAAAMRDQVKSPWVAAVPIEGGLPQAEDNKLSCRVLLLDASARNEMNCGADS